MLLTLFNFFELLSDFPDQKSGGNGYSNDVDKE